MPSLASKLRKDLENAVKQARRAAETGAGKALDLLAVGHHEPWGSLKPEQRRLRNRLRAHGVQLGDARDDKRGTQSVMRLTGEVAYEQWHRMLFARYLAENELLIEPKSGQAMSMDECRELAREQLKAILAGEPPFDLFVRWKPLHEQPIGWNPDINDGVRLNLRPFITAKPLNARGKNACILRSTPKVSWDKDRGKEPQRAKADFPWFWTWDEATADFKGGSAFDGNRWNDCHYTTATKQAARERHKK